MDALSKSTKLVTSTKWSVSRKFRTTVSKNEIVDKKKQVDMQTPPEWKGKTTTFRRYSKLSDNVINLGDGESPPAQKINPDYKRQPSNPRKCIECGKIHDTIVEDTMTGERLSEIEKCKDCLMSGCLFNLRTDQVELQSEWGGTARCITSDGRNVNMAEELNRLEKELINGVD